MINEYHSQKPKGNFSYIEKLWLPLGIGVFTMLAGFILTALNATDCNFTKKSSGFCVVQAKPASATGGMTHVISSNPSIKIIITISPGE